jgi:hypothetical protein
MSEQQRREFHEALLDADSFEDLPGRWQAAIVAAEQHSNDIPKARPAPDPLAGDMAPVPAIGRPSGA